MAKKQQKLEHMTEERAQYLKERNHKIMLKLREKKIQKKKQQQTEKVPTELEITTRQYQPM